jgi:LPXTG-motif cell wall-anchored protein
VKLARIAAVAGIGILATLTLTSPAHASTDVKPGDPCKSITAGLVTTNTDGSQYTCTGATKPEQKWVLTRAVPAVGGPCTGDETYRDLICASGKWATKPTSTVEQTCINQADVDAKHVKTVGDITVTCANVNGTIKWDDSKGSTVVNQTCANDVDVQAKRTGKLGNITVTCVNFNGTIVWMPPAGTQCPAGFAGCATQPAPALGATCPVTGETIDIAGAKCTCTQAKTAGVYTWVKKADAGTESLPVTGASVIATVAVSLFLLAIGAGLFVMARRRKVRFTA